MVFRNQKLSNLALSKKCKNFYCSMQLKRSDSNIFKIGAKVCLTLCLLFLVPKTQAAEEFNPSSATLPSTTISHRSTSTTAPPPSPLWRKYDRNSSTSSELAVASATPLPWTANSRNTDACLIWQNGSIQRQRSCATKYNRVLWTWNTNKKRNEQSFLFFVNVHN